MQRTAALWIASVYKAGLPAPATNLPSLGPTHGSLCQAL